jgi:hypothetical protein
MGRNEEVGRETAMLDQKKFCSCMAVFLSKLLSGKRKRASGHEIPTS